MGDVRRRYFVAAVLVTVACGAAYGTEPGLVPRGFDPARVELGLKGQRLADGAHKVKTTSTGWSIYAEVLNGRVVALRGVGPKGARSIPFMCVKDRLGKVFVAPVRDTVRRQSRAEQAAAEKLAREKAWQELFEQAVNAAECWDCIKFDVSDKDWGPIYCERVACSKGI